MADKLQHRLHKFEIEPPVSLWSAIEKELDEANETGRLSARLQLLEVAPPENAWLNIASALDEDKKEPAKLIDLNWRKVAVAASVIAVAGTLSFFLLFNRGAGKTEAANTTVSVVNPAKPNPSTIIQDVPPSTIAGNIQPETSKSKYTGRAVATKFSNREPRPSKLLASNVVLHEDDNIEITAPPITDQSGNTILDKALLVSDSSPYITVTSPSGEKTRISAKFLGYLDKLFHQKGQDDEWKNRFEHWKKIMLQDASLAPAPGNYMDLLELKDILIEQ